MDIRGILRRLTRSALLLTLPLAAVPAVLAPAALHAQQDQTPRTVDGKVVDKDGAPVKGARVYLKDDHSLSVKTFFSADDGTYRFGQLASNGDYTIWAEADGKKSGTKSISSFDSRHNFEFVLKLDK